MIEYFTYVIDSGLQIQTYFIPIHSFNPSFLPEGFRIALISVSVGGRGTQANKYRAGEERLPAYSFGRGIQETTESPSNSNPG